MCVLRPMHTGKNLLSQTKREETGFSVRNLWRRVVLETGKVLVMFGCVDGDLQDGCYLK